MNIYEYNQLEEVVYKETLSNGLTVHLLPKKEFHKTFAILYTDFGSVDRTFIPRGKTDFKTMPDGMAHFLEHKMFEKKEGDVFHLFSSQGASANAYTGYTKTAYFFSATSHLKENINTLLNCVQEPYFTGQTVQKEKGIITQEIEMYHDDPDWQVMIGLMENLYPHHPAEVDIAGTVESIQMITAELLMESYQTFYHPDNMHVCIVGNIDPEHALTWITDNQENREFPETAPITRALPAQSITEVLPFREVEMPVKIPKVMLGVKGNKYQLKPEKVLRHVLIMDLLLELIFGETSSTYLSLYNDGIIDDSFSFDYTFERTFDYVSVGGDSKMPEQLSEALKNVLINSKWNPDITSEHFENLKKKMTGQALQSLDSLEYIAHNFVDYNFGDKTIFDSISVLETITIDDVKELAEDYFKEERMSLFAVKSK